MGDGTESKLSIESAIEARDTASVVPRERRIPIATTKTHIVQFALSLQWHL